MFKRFNAYAQFAKMTFFESLAYATEFWGWIIVAVLIYSVYYFLWAAIYMGRTEIAGMTFLMTMTHLIISTLVSWSVLAGPLNFIGEAIMTGELGKELIRPVSFPLYCLARALGQIVVNFTTRGIPLTLLGIFLSGIMLPDFLQLFPFVLAVVFAFIIFFMFDFIVSQAVIFIETYFAIAATWRLFLSYTSGAIIPFPFIPEGIRNVIFFLPFHCIFATPINVFMGVKLVKSPLAEKLVLLGLNPTAALLVEQAGWACILTLLAIVLWRMASRHIVVQGG